MTEHVARTLFALYVHLFHSSLETDLAESSRVGGVLFTLWTSGAAVVWTRLYLRGSAPACCFLHRS